jgi:LemA protein
MRAWSVGLLAVAVLFLSGCGYNNLQTQDESVKAAWSEVVNQYQRRADLIPNLVNTVKGYAAQEQKVLIGVTEARAKVGSIQVTPEVLNNPELFAKYQAAQNQLTSALKSLFAVTENYPQLKSDQNFRDLQSQIEGTENRVTVARNRYIQAVQSYNVTVRQFPVNLTAKMFGFQVKPNFTVANEAQISTAPTVNFDTSTPGTPAPAPSGQPATQ